MNRNLEEDYENPRRFERYGFSNRNNEEGHDDERRNLRKDQYKNRIPERGSGADYYSGYNRDNRRGQMNNGPQDRRRGGNSRYQRRFESDQEPEWMSADVEQGDMMELRGFDDPIEPGNDKRSEEKQQPMSNKQNDVKDVNNDGLQPKDKNFNFDGFLQMESISGLGLESVEAASESNSIQQSRFSKFFQQQQNDQPETANRESENFGQNNIRSINEEPNIKIPSPGGVEANSCCFAPISPAAKTTLRTANEPQQPNHNHQQSDSLMHLLKMPGKDAQKPTPSALSQLRGKNVKSLGGLGANLRQMAVSGQQQQQHQHQQQQHQQPKPNPEADLSAFNRFAAMVGTNAQTQNQNHMDAVFSKLNAPPSGIVRPNPISAMEHGQHGPFPRPQQHQQNNNGPTQSQFQPRMRMDQMSGVLDFIWRAPFNVDILHRPEAHNLIKALDRGDATNESLIHQFCHGNLPKLHSEIVLNVLKLQQSKGLLGNNRPSPKPEQQNIQPMHQQQPRLSPCGTFPHQSGNPGNNKLAVSPTSGQQRIPSPQELVYHTQQIMQNALIRRKLEEQKENYRKKTETTDAGQKAAEYSDPALSSLNFTPTVVMKGLAAERRDSDPRVMVPELRVNQMSAANDDENSGQQPNKTPSPHSQGQPQMCMMPPVPLPPPNPSLMMLHNQQLQAQAQAQAMQVAAMRNQIGDPRMVPGMDPQQPSMNPMIPPGQSGGLSKFFGPEVFAQVQAGQAPSMPPLPTQKVMTLEELECQAAASH